MLYNSWLSYSYDVGKILFGSYPCCINIAQPRWRDLIDTNQLACRISRRISRLALVAFNHRQSQARIAACLSLMSLESTTLFGPIEERSELLRQWTSSHVPPLLVYEVSFHHFFDGPVITFCGSPATKRSRFFFVTSIVPLIVPVEYHAI